MLPPIPRVPFRQHSSASQSSTGTPVLLAGGDDSDAPFTPPQGEGQGGEGVAPSVEMTSKDATTSVKLSKGVSMEDEAARLTIEVSPGT